MHERLKIVIVGGNRIAAQLATDFRSRSFVDVVAVADLFDDSPGAIAAEHLGLPFTTEITALSSIAPNPDLIIDMAEWPGVTETLHEAYPDAAAGSPTIIHDAGARLVLSLAAETTDPLPHRSPSFVGADC